jgi:pyruvate dehydrogenase E2 component (dihydrolipoamide acetyltransferase)
MMSETPPGEAFSLEGEPAPSAAKPAIRPITMPKWGLAMEEGVLARWAVEEGAEIAQGQEILDIETTKIANAFESPVTGTLRRRVAAEGETLPVGALLGVVAPAEVPEAELDAFVSDFLEHFKPAEAGEAAPEPETIEAGGHRIRRLKAGPESGTPILLIHGFGADMTSWMFNQAELAKEHPVHAIDLPGHGGSSKEVQGSPAELAAAVLAYMDAAGIAAAHLVGHSLGGSVAVEVALTSPDRVTALTLIAPAGFGVEIAQDFIEGFVGESRPRKLRPVLEMLVADPAMVTADMVEAVLKFKRLDGATQALRAIADANFAGGAQKSSVRGRLKELKVPVHVVWGEHDRILPVAHADGLPPEVRVTRIAAAGHIPHMEKAAEVNAAILATSG